MGKVAVRDSVVLVTGANRPKGIGRALVNEAVHRGAKKVYATARNKDQLQGIDGIVPIELDVTNRKQIEQVAKEASDTQILINNAGICGFTGCFDNYDEKIAREEMEVNCFAPLHLMRAFANHLVQNGNGAIVNIVSIAGLIGFPMAATYSASKAALYSLTQSVRIELGEQGVSVFGAYPGPIQTDMTVEMEVEKESPTDAARRIFDAMEEGIEEITTDSLSDAFKNWLKADESALEALERRFS